LGGIRYVGDFLVTEMLELAEQQDLAIVVRSPRIRSSSAIIAV